MVGEAGWSVMPHWAGLGYGWPAFASMFWPDCKILRSTVCSLSTSASENGLTAPRFQK